MSFPLNALRFRQLNLRCSIIRTLLVFAFGGSTTNRLLVGTREGEDVAKESISFICTVFILYDYGARVRLEDPIRRYNINLFVINQVAEKVDGKCQRTAERGR